VWTAIGAIAAAIIGALVKAFLGGNERKDFDVKLENLGWNKAENKMASEQAEAARRASEAKDNVVKNAGDLGAIIDQL